MTAGLSAQNKMQNYVDDNTHVSFAGVVGSDTMPYISFSGQERAHGVGQQQQRSHPVLRG